MNISEFYIDSLAKSVVKSIRYSISHVKDVTVLSPSQRQKYNIVIYK